ncbi:MAG: DNA-processing protein DprA [Aquimonas sp.]|nr:DNA-processing protein DprA [Aquimonas sp.]
MALAAELWLAALRAPLPGRVLRALAEQPAEAEATLGCGDSRRLRALGISEVAQRAVLEPDPDDLARDSEWLAQPGNRLILWSDPDYPELLREAPSPPPALCTSGDAHLLWRAQVAIVGSRNPTAGGADTAAAFAGHFARSGLLVTSGLAEGIDAAAHRAALDSGEPTVAVVGTGPDRVYPARHRALAEQIRSHGCIVSEFAPGTAARAEHFPRRNRIIAALSLGTLVVEAAQRSGALITARNASESGREVFAIPGSIHNPLARGCHRLIREGAALVETADEVIEALRPGAQRLAGLLQQRLGEHAALPSAAPACPASEAVTETDPERARLLKALGHDPVGIDQLAERTGLTVGVLSSMLLMLELEGVVSARHGRYARRSS